MSSYDMAKLTNEDIRWILKRASSRDFSVKNASEIHGLMGPKMQQQTKIYCDTEEVPTLNPNRERKKHLSDEQKAIIDEFWEETGLGVRLLFYELKRRGYRIPHTKIHQYLRETDRTTHNPGKQKKRKRCRYEREHSGSMVHGDNEKIVVLNRVFFAPHHYETETLHHKLSAFKLCVNSYFTT